MFVRVEDIKGKVYWVNPLYVRAVREKKRGQVELVGTFTAFGGAIVTSEPADSIADRLSVAMPDSPAMIAALEDQAQQQQQQQNAAGAALS